MIEPNFKLVQLTSIDSSKLHFPNIASLKDVLINSERWFVIDGQQLYSRETCFRNPYIYTHFIQNRFSSDRQFAVVKLDPIKDSYDKALLLGGCDNYCHWLIRYLSRLALIEDIDEFLKLPLLVNCDLYPFQKQSLELLGIDEKRLIKIPPYTTVNCKKLIIPFCPALKKSLLRIGVYWLRKVFGKHFGVDRRRYLYVSREDATRRHITNEKSVWSLLQSLGFEKVIPTLFSFKDQVKLFSEAKVIVGAHGAGLTNCIFAPKNCLLIEFKDILNNHTKTFEFLADAVNLLYHRLISTKVSIYKNAQIIVSYHDFKVDICELKSLLESVLPCKNKGTVE